MRVRRSVGVARILGTLAIAAVPAFVWLGWWGLTIPVALALASGATRPRAHRTPSISTRRALRDALARRLRRHSWRPGVRL